MRTALSSDALPKLTAKQSRSDSLSAVNRIQRKSSARAAPGVAPSDPIFPLEITPAILGNHLAVQGFLQRTLHRPSPPDFAAAVARPDYAAAERHIVRTPHERDLVAHMQLEPQQVRFGRVDIPIVRLRDLAVLPEYERQDLHHRMVLHGERLARESGAMLIVARGENHRLLRRHGWSSLGCDPVSVVSPQRLLGQLPPPAVSESPFFQEELPVREVRIARLTDVEQLKALYDRQSAFAYGATIRSEAHWAWLIKKAAHNRIYLYSEDGRPLAYGVVRCASVLELIDTTDDHRGAAGVLQRVGADAIEQGRHTVRIYAPFGDQSHAWSDQGGGQIFVGPVEESWMVKILSVRSLIRRLATELHRRVRHLGSHADLGVRVGSESFLIQQGVRSMRITRNNADHRIEMTYRAATQLLLGYRDVDTLVEKRMLMPSSDQALATARELFPAVGIWRTKWDDVPVLGN